jgi:glycosyltransferase involved in cell wall biosynthesis
MAVYNGESFLRAACDAILAQTFTDFELIISDNGSTDATESICREYAARDERVHYYRNEQNRGGIWNRNRVFALSRGDYFLWHDHDDAIVPTFLERCVAVLDARPEVVNCYANVQIIDEHGQILRHYAEGAALRSTSAYARLRHYIRHDRECALCSIYFGLMRRATLAQTTLFHPYIDSELSLMSELALRGQFHEIADHLFIRRDHPGISTRRYATNKERMAWFDPAKVGRAGGAGWRVLGARLRAITVVPMTPYDRLRCVIYTAELFKHLAIGAASSWLGLFRTAMHAKCLTGIPPGSSEQIAATRR